MKEPRCEGQTGEGVEAEANVGIYFRGVSGYNWHETQGISSKKGIIMTH